MTHRSKAEQRKHRI